MNRAITLALAVMTFAVLTALPSAADAAQCSGAFQYDSEGYRWDISSPLNYGMGTFYDGGSNGPTGTPAGVRSASDSYDDWGMLFVGEETPESAYALKQDDGCFNEEAGRELVFPRLTIDGLEVQRKIYVSETGLPEAVRLRATRRAAGRARLAARVSDSAGNSVRLARRIRIRP